MKMCYAMFRNVKLKRKKCHGSIMHILNGKDVRYTVPLARLPRMAAPSMANWMLASFLSISSRSLSEK